jgi:hypothetical protein
VQQERLKSIKTKLTQWFALYRPLIQKRNQTQEGSLGLRYSAANADQGQRAENSSTGTLFGKQPPQTAYEEQAVLVMCNGLFNDMRFSLDEIRTFEEKRFYGNE